MPDASRPDASEFTNASVLRVLWWVCLVAAPLALLVIELFHPAGFSSDPYQYLSQAEPHTSAHKALAYFGPEWWFTLHFLQTPLMGLVAVGLVLLVRDVTRADGAAALALAWGSRAAAFVFFVFYNALDSIGGIGLGRTILRTQELEANGTFSPEQVQDVVAPLLRTMWTDPWVGGVGSVVSLTGSWAVFFSAALAAGALWLAKQAPWPALLLLAGFGWELQVGHPMPHGPIAFALLAASAVWIAWSRRAAGPTATA